MAETKTPMMRQYLRIKRGLPEDTILFFRLGDFYEMFFEDAKAAAPILDIALTKRNNIPMCGVPHHAMEGYLAKLIRGGKKVAICDQVEDASASKGIVRREVTRVVTAGTVTGDGILEAGRNNFLAGIYHADGVYGLALLDVSTGLFCGEETDSVDALRDGLARFGPTECLVPADGFESGQYGGLAGPASGTQVSPCEDWTFEYDAARDGLTRHFGTQSLEGFGLEGKPALVGAAGAVLHYVKDALRSSAGHIRSFRVRQAADVLLLDEATCANLDLLPVQGRGGSVALLNVLDVTRTAMGSRKIRDWLLRPLVNLDAICARHEAVGLLCDNGSLRQDLVESLSGVRDMERLIVRIATSGGNARDLVAIGRSLGQLPAIKALLETAGVPALESLAATIEPLPELAGLIGRALVDEPPMAVKEGGLIREGYREELDEVRRAAAQGKSWLAEYQAGEQERTGIKTLKVRFNKVFGYYIEVSKAQADNVPPEYVRKQTLVNAERFITPELKEHERTVLGAQERAMAMEYDLFLEVRDAVVAETARIQASADAVAQADVLAALADRAGALGYVRPSMDDSRAIRIKGGRHPVVEQMPDAERFVPNDTVLDGDENQIVIITGPNMAGKSTYIRQVALVVIMAQMGSFVPAAEARIGLVDRVFTRVGASDDLARGRSTFMVEMQETANILNNATPSSLVVLDEIGRGTSTFDGISIAWAVAEHLHDNGRVKAKTLFATHYHELTDLALTMKGVKNYNVLVREQGDSIVFLRKIVPGGSDKSYGIHVARLAGMPPEVIDRAGEILSNLEEGELAESGQPRLARTRRRKGRYSPDQLGLFDE